jgi:hypothetical protein
MASTGTFTGDTVDGPNHYSVEWNQTINAGNTSLITWVAYWHFGGTTGCRDLGNAYFYAAGAYRLDSRGDYNAEHTYNSGHSNHGKYNIGSGTFTVTHDANGYYTLSGSGSCTGYSNAHSNFGTTTFALNRNPVVPDAPGTPTATSTYNSITVTYAAPADNGGASITGYDLQIDDVSNFASPTTAADTASPYVFGSLSPGKTYYVRVRAKNSQGAGAYSGTRTIATAATVPGAPATPTFSAITPVAASVSYAAPSSTGGSAITGYDINYARDTAYTLNSVTVADTASPLAISGLLPGTNYYVRVRAKNAVGVGAWSANGTFKTLPGAWIGNGTAWQPALVWVGDGTVWKTAQIHTGDGTVWKP